MSEEQSIEHYYLGVDLGGAKILAGVFGEDLKLLGKNKYGPNRNAVSKRLFKGLRVVFWSWSMILILKLSRCVDWDRGTRIYCARRGCYFCRESQVGECSA
jgi:hypothetical protein